MRIEHHVVDRMRQRTLAGKHRLVLDAGQAGERDHQQAAVVARGLLGARQPLDLVEPEVRPVDQRDVARRDVPVEPFAVRLALRHADALLEMQLARAAVVVEAVGDVGVLLDLDDRAAAADRMHRVGRDVEEVAGPDRVPHEHVLDRAVERRAAHRFGVDRLPEADSQRRPGFGVDHQPAFLLALAAETHRLGLRVGRVHLDRQLVAGEQVLDQQLRQVRRRHEPDLTDPLAGGRLEGRGQQVLPPRFFDGLRFEQHASLTPHHTIRSSSALTSTVANPTALSEMP